MRFWAELLIALLGGVAGCCWGLDQEGTCEPIKIDMCKFVGYNKTRMPNLATHTLQADAKFEVRKTQFYQ